MIQNYDPIKVARGDYPDVLPDYKFGASEVGASLTTIWSGSEVQAGLYVYPDTAGETIYVSSTSVNDADGDAGLWSLSIKGLDENNDVAEETIILDGQNQVPSVKKYRRVWRMKGIHGSAPNGALGSLYAGTSGAVGGVPSGTVYMYVGFGEQLNQTQMALVSVPKGYRMTLFDYDLGAYEDKKTTVYLAQRNGLDPNAVWTVGSNLNLRNVNVNVLKKYMSSLPAGTDIEMRAITETGTEEVTAGFTYLFIKSRS